MLVERDKSETTQQNGRWMLLGSMCENVKTRHMTEALRLTGQHVECASVSVFVCVCVRLAATAVPGKAWSATSH